MPVEIKELIIRINVNDTSRNNNTPPTISIQEVVRESLEELTDQLKKQKER